MDPRTVIADLPRARLPAFPGWLAALGPGIVWMALAQGSGELIWWPYIIAKYGLGFLFLLVPACLLQFPLSYEIGRYTLLTGESIFHGFFRLHRGLGIFLWLLMTVSFLWFGAFASAGGTALAALTGQPAGWSPRGQTLFWAYLSIGIFVAALLASGVVYNLIERFMKCVALVTVAGMLWSCAQPEVWRAAPAFFGGLLLPHGGLARPWDAEDATKLLTAVTFAGLGGFWILFYSYWLRDKGSGMAARIGRITGPLSGKPEAVSCDGFLPEQDTVNAALWTKWRRFLATDVLIGLIGNLLTTVMTCLLAYALLFPAGLLPAEYDIAVVQSLFFEISLGEAGRILFLVVAAAFLADTWLVTADAVARLQADIVNILFPASRRIPTRRWYYLFIAALTVITCLTMLLEAPGPLILLSAVIGFLGTVLFPPLLYRVNHRLLARHVPRWARPSRASRALLLVSFCAYLALAAAYVAVQLL
ncbi:MAG: Nramp family divalent metal transporter [Gammaproteobacteria bacterium]|nr:Nramp family divalent metal transporter [Gammaproteobacteria bacterium]